jgi:hypothetical protein
MRKHEFHVNDAGYSKVVCISTFNGHFDKQGHFAGRTICLSSIGSKLNFENAFVMAALSLEFVPTVRSYSEIRVDPDFYVDQHV